MPLGSREAGYSALMVGQDGILRAGWQPAPVAWGGPGRVNNPPQVSNLPHDFASHRSPHAYSPYLCSRR